MTAAVRPEALLRELHDLWIKLGRHAEAEEGGGVLRACSMTLIAAMDEEEDPVRVAGTIAEVMLEHPSRAIILRHRASQQPFLEAKVSAQCWARLGERRQICSEQIEIAASSAALASTAGLILPLIAPDLPVAVWCRSTRLFDLDAFEPIAMLAGKLIVDSAQLGDARHALVKLSEANTRQRVADLAWARLTPWREIVAQAFQSRICRERGSRIAELRLKYSGPSVPAEALYMAAWLSGALDWPDTRDRIRFECGERTGSPVLSGVVLAGSDLTVSVERTGEQELTVAIDGTRQRTFLPGTSPARELSEELSVFAEDPMYARTLTLACRLTAEARA